MSKIGEVEFVTRSEAEEMEPVKFTGVIAIASPCGGSSDLRPGWDPVLRLEFEDAEGLEEFEAMCEAEGIYHAEPRLFGAEHADAILSWLDRYEDGLERIVVHCDDNQRRSAAVARFIADRYGIEEFNRENDEYNQLVLNTLTWKAEKKDKSSDTVSAARVRMPECQSELSLPSDSDEEPFRLAVLTTLIRVEDTWTTPGRSLIDGIETRYQEIFAACTAFGSFGEFRLELYEPFFSDLEPVEDRFEQTMQLLKKGAVLVVEGAFEFPDSKEPGCTIYGGKLSPPGRLEHLYVTDRDAWAREAKKP